MHIDRLDHMVITTEHLPECLQFYTEVLGMKHDNSGGRHALFFGMQKINLHTKKGEFLPAAKNVTYGSQDFCLIADGDINEIYNEILSKGYPIEEGIVIRTGSLGTMKSIYLRDPDGNLVEISVYLSSENPESL